MNIENEYRTGCYITVFSVILLAGIWLHRSYLADYPNYIHAWSQSDRYALSIGFVNNGLNIFYPETFLLNKVKWDISDPKSITPAEFPVHEYIIAIIMKLTGSTSPVIFRMYILLYSFIGLFFLFKLSKLLIKDFFYSLLVVIFVATAPSYVYYQSGFLPTIPCLSNVIIACYFYIKYSQQQKKTDFNLTLLFLTLSALNRLTFVIPLIAVFCFEFLRIVKKESSFLPKILPVLLSLISISAYFLWNIHLKNNYGALFLNQLLPPETFRDTKELLFDTYYKWNTHYFSVIHYGLFTIVFVLALFFSIKKRLSSTSSKIKNKHLSLWILCFIWIFGCTLFCFVMMKQFPDHDYYFLDTLFIPCVFCFILLLSYIPNYESKWFLFVKFFLITGIFIPLLLNATAKQHERRDTSWDDTLKTIHFFEGSSSFLDSVGVSRSAKIISMGSYPPNMSFILMERKGYFFPQWFKPDRINTFLTFDFDYIILSNEFFVENFQQYYDIFSRFNKIADNGKIAVCTYTDTIVCTSITQFLELSDKKILLSEKLSFDSEISEYWKNTEISTEIAFSGEKCGTLSSEQVWGIAYRTKNTEMFTVSDKTVLYTIYCTKESSEDNYCIVLLFQNSKEKVYCRSYSLRDEIPVRDNWYKLEILFQVPQLQELIDEKYEMILHIYSPNKHNGLYYDDIEFVVY